MTASCETFERWLDAGRPASAEPAARAHAANCARCAASLRAALAVEGLLAAGLAPAPAGFAARVMERVEAARRAGAGRAGKARMVITSLRPASTGRVEQRHSVSAAAPRHFSCRMAL